MPILWVQCSFVADLTIETFNKPITASKSYCLVCVLYACMTFLERVSTLKFVQYFHFFRMINQHIGYTLEYSKTFKVHFQSVDQRETKRLNAERRKKAATQNK